MKIGVIGGGPSGMMAAYIAAEKNEVTLLEKNEKLGKKLYITGKGRCNLTNNKDISEFFNEISRNEKFLYSALYTFTNLDTIQLFKRYGLETIVERGERVFPKSNKSSDVIKSYEKMLKDRKVDIRLGCKVNKIEKLNNKFYINKNMEFDKIIIATGGISYSSTGSTGDGYKFAKNFNIKVEDLKPALVPIELEDTFLKDLQGLSLKNINLIAKSNKKIIHEEFGELLFSHFGITGPTVLRMSNMINRRKSIQLFIDLKPALGTKQLDQRVVRDFSKYNNKAIINALNDLLPKKLIPVVLKTAEINSYKVVNSITKEERRNLVDSIKRFPLKYKNLLDINAAIVTSGGVSVKEINPQTMESNKVKNLYFCGEVLDVEAFTGGYNIQIANSTGYLAGLMAGEI